MYLADCIFILNALKTDFDFVMILVCFNLKLIVDEESNLIQAFIYSY